MSVWITMGVVIRHVTIMKGLIVAVAILGMNLDLLILLTL